MNCMKEMKMNKQKMYMKQSGFTLIEVMVVIVERGLFERDF